MTFIYRTWACCRSIVKTIASLVNTVPPNKKKELFMEETKNKFLEEGKARLLLTSDRVFYNPVQEFNRDLSILVIRAFIDELRSQDENRVEPDNKKRGLKNANQQNNEKITVLEALSATGLRSIRYAKEIPNIDEIIANDISLQAVESIKTNVKLNEVDDIIKTSHEDATIFMYKNRRYPNQFTILDLDPYGCPSIFLDGAVQCVKDGGLLLVTATDMAVLAGNSPETCYSKYGAVSLKTKACHEQGLRILLQCIESHANRYGRYIVPLLSISADFYIRVFVRIFTGPVHCKKSTSKLSIVYQCVGCETFSLQALGSFKPNPSPSDPGRLKACLPHAPPVNPNCEHCNHRFHMGGPIWTGPLHEPSFVEKVLKIVDDDSEKFSTSKRIKGLLYMVLEELHDVPLYYSVARLCSIIHVEMMPMLKMRSALMNGGFRVSYSHACKSSIKTDAPASFMWDVIKTWEKMHPVKKDRLGEGTPGLFLLSKDIVSSVDFTERNDANPDSRKQGFLRFQYNPTPFWGPGTRATAKVGEDKMEKSKKNQNKKSIRKTDNASGLKRDRSPDDDDAIQKKIMTEKL